MDHLLPKLRADLLVYAIPLYIYTVPGKVKDFFDRQLPLLEPFLIEKDGVSGHPRRDAAEPPKTFLISVAGFPERSHFDELVRWFEKIGSHDFGKILIGGSEPMSKDELQGAYTEVYQQVEQAGFEVGQDGRMSAETEQAILDLTTQTPEQITQFHRTANAYWESLIPKEPKLRELKATANAQLKVSDPGIASVMAGMAAQYNPKALPGLSAVIQFTLDDETVHLLIQDERCRAYQGTHPEPDLTILTPQQVWLDISSGKIDGTKAFMDGLYTTEGDMKLLMKLDTMFSPGALSGEHVGATPPATDHIPEHRGPIKIPHMTWLTIAFIPWIIRWAAGSALPGPAPCYIAAAAAVLIMLYHRFTNVSTLFETGTALYFIIASAITASGWTFFQEFGSVIDYIFLAGLWFGSLPLRFALTAEYSRYGFPKVIWDNFAFKATNTIITAAWGGYYLVAVILNLMLTTGYGSPGILKPINFGLLIPMFIFTGKFQKWYPEKLMS